jgi:hypothetical protein
LLYQYGVYAFTGQDMFHLDLTRQFEITDDAGQHEGYVQFHCTLRYRPDPELAALGRQNHWWFHDSDGEPLQEDSGITSRQVFPTSKGREPWMIRKHGSRPSTTGTICRSWPMP